MQIVQSKSNFVEKIITDKNGRLVRAIFCVYKNGGRIKARLVDFTYLDQNILTGSVATLSGFSKTKSSQRKDLWEGLVTSPYFSFEILYSSGSKPRAPTF